MEAARLRLKLRALSAFVSAHWRGVLVCALAAIAAKFLSEHYGAPAMLMALLLGLALNFLGEPENVCARGVEYSARAVLRWGVALLGARISFELFAELGIGAIIVVVLAIAATVGFGLLLARAMGQPWRLAVLTAGAVSICGASAALALSAVLPKSAQGERDLGFTVFGVTILSTLAMVAYPIIGSAFALSDEAMGLFLGGTIHDVAQVVGAGFTVSETVGEASTTVKLLRVSMLAPFILLLVLILRRSLSAAQLSSEARPPLVPGFVAAFFALAALNSVGFLPLWLQEAVWELSKWLLLTAVAAVGVKTDLRRILEIPPQSVLLILAQTVFLAMFVLSAVVLVL